MEFNELFNDLEDLKEKAWDVFEEEKTKLALIPDDLKGSKMEEELIRGRQKGRKIMDRYYKVGGCWDCPERRDYDNGKETCSGTGKERVLKPTIGFPKWCPLLTKKDIADSKE